MLGQAHSKSLEAALDYRAHGWSVIPVVCGTKRPAVRWLAYQAYPPSAEEIREWFRHWPEAGVAIVTGSASKLVVIDVDPTHGGVDSLLELEREHGPLPPTIEAISGGGGRHLYFLHPGGEIRNKIGFASGLDVRGDGGYIVAPPSLHASGKHYVWRRSHDPDSIAAAPLPAWLQLQLQLSKAIHHPGHTVEHWRSLVHAGIGEGERNNSIASLTGHLLWHGVDPEVAMELLLCWNHVRCRPPLADEEVIRTVLSITRLHQSRESKAT